MKAFLFSKIIKRVAQVATGGGLVGTFVGIESGDSTIALISELTALVSSVVAGVAYLIEVKAKADGRIGLNDDIDGNPSN